jgi:hypothetical protein
MFRAKADTEEESNRSLSLLAREQAAHDSAPKGFSGAELRGTT